MASDEWEYKILEGAQESLERILNERARQGWEPIMMSCTEGPHAASAIVILLRRPREGA